MFANLKVSTRLALAFGTIVVMLVIVSALGVSRMASLNEHMHAVTDENDPEARLASELNTIAYDIGVSVRDIIILTDAEALRARHEELEEDFRHMDETVGKLNKMFTDIASTTATEKDLLGKITTALAVSKTSANKTADLGMVNKNVEAAALLKAKNVTERFVIARIVGHLWTVVATNREHRWRQRPSPCLGWSIAGVRSWSVWPIGALRPLLACPVRVWPRWTPAPPPAAPKPLGGDAARPQSLGQLCRR